MGTLSVEAATPTTSAIAGQPLGVQVTVTNGAGGASFDVQDIQVYVVSDASGTSNDAMATPCTLNLGPGVSRTIAAAASQVYATTVVPQPCAGERYGAGNLTSYAAFARAVVRTTDGQMASHTSPEVTVARAVTL